VLFDSPNFHELVIQTDISVDTVINSLAQHGIVAGVNLSKHYPELNNVMSICVTETKTRADIDAFVNLLAQKTDS
jgi:glycine dehydrogenase subunit 1